MGHTIININTKKNCVQQIVMSKLDDLAISNVCNSGGFIIFLKYN